AIAAESLRDRRDDTDFAAAVAVAPPLRNLAGIVGTGARERKHGVDRADNFGGRHDVVHPPAACCADVHELDEADDVSRAAEGPRHVDDATFVHSALHHHV